MPAIDRLLNRAIQLARCGNKADARRLLVGIITSAPDNQAAWLWYADTFGNLDERLRVFETALKHCPDMPMVQRAHRLLVHTRAQQRGAQKEAAPRRPSRMPAWLILICIVLAGLSVTFGAISLLETYQIQQLSQKNQSLQAVYDQSRRSLERLTGDLVNLTGRYNTMQVNYKGLETRHNDLQNRHNQLTQEYQGLVARDLELQNNFNTLNTEYHSLADKNNLLQNQYNTLTKNFDDLQKKSIVPPYISVRDRTVLLSFYKTDQSILYWEVPFDVLEMDIERGYAARQAMYESRNQMVLTGEAGAKYDVVDFRHYVDPTTFRGVIADLYQQSPDETTFMREVWNIVAQLTMYNSELGEKPRFPLETLLAGGGDCEDTSILFASMVKAAPVNWKVSLVYLNSKHIHEVTAPNHVIVSVDTGNRTYLVETTSKDTMLPYKNGVTGWYLEVP